MKLKFTMHRRSTIKKKKKGKKILRQNFIGKNHGFLFHIVVSKRKEKKKGRKRKTTVKERKVVPPVRTTTSARIAYETSGNKVGNPATKGAYRQPTGVT